MTSMTKIVSGAITGFFIGCAIVFLTVVGAVAFAYAIGGRVEIPGVFVAWFSTGNGLPVLVEERPPMPFRPGPTGDRVR